MSSRALAFPNPAAANRAGVVCVFQELSLVPDLTVADNILIADPPRRFGLIDARSQRRRAAELLAAVGCADLDPRLRVRDLPLSRRQMVEIAKALAKDPQLLILDEATSALTAAEVERVYGLLARLKAAGVAILYISHRIHEIDALADTLSTLSGGNQQKVVIAKWLMTAPGLILLNDPTRGIDVGTKQEIYRLLRDLADAGAGILFYSTDYDELIGCCDRVSVMYDGRIVRELEGAAITEQAIVASALNLGAGHG